jgi:hypothetical protein
MEDVPKRKRGDASDDAARAAKRLTPAPSERAAHQRDIAAVYAAYDALHASVEEGQGQEADYLSLLQAASGEPTPPGPALLPACVGPACAPAAAKSQHIFKSRLCVPPPPNPAQAPPQPGA